MIYLLLITVLLSVVLFAGFYYVYKKGQSKQREMEKEQVQELTDLLESNAIELSKEGLRESQIENLTKLKRDDNFNYYPTSLGRKRQDLEQMARISTLIYERIDLEDELTELLIRHSM